MIRSLDSRRRMKEIAVERKELILCQHITVKYCGAMLVRDVVPSGTHLPSGVADDACVQSAHIWHHQSRAKPAIREYAPYAARK